MMGRTDFDLGGVTLNMIPEYIPAHFDGHHIQLDADVDLEPNARLIVKVIQEVDSDLSDEMLWGRSDLSDEDKSFREDWSRLGLAAMAALYERDERASQAELPRVSHSESKK